MRKPVIKLSSLTAQRIAAGEVIERPHSVVRELMDNAVDSGASRIDVHLEQGGIDSIRVIDNGHGMTAEDLALCCESHATSKITSIEDLDALETLGFRGEALSSIAACADISITSGTSEGACHILKAGGSRNISITPGGNTVGSVVEVRRLFYEIPGRKKFLHSPQAEGNSCRKVFLDKALPFPNIQFRFFSNHELKLFFPPGSLSQRVLQAYGHLADSSLMKEMEYDSEVLSMTGIISSPSLYRSDRSYIHIFVNNRRVSEYSLVQAVVQGYNEVLPGGAFPYCFLFLRLPPDIVDFNIHPAKKEIRFRGQREIHHQVTTAIRQWLGTKKTPQVFSQSQEVSEAPSWFPEVTSSANRAPAAPSNWYREALPLKDAKGTVSHGMEDDGFIYLGQIFNLFLVVQRGDALYIIDQHAAHERIIYDEISSGTSVQPLLVPISFTVEQEIHEFLESHGDLYRDAGIEISAGKNRTWEIIAVPAVCRGIESDLVELIAESAGDPEQIKVKLFAMVSCRAAVKDGEPLDPVSARELIKKTFGLPFPRCPHGRPVWKEITREQLFKDVHRILSGTPDRRNSSSGSPDQMK